MKRFGFLLPALAMVAVPALAQQPAAPPRLPAATVCGQQQAPLAQPPAGSPPVVLFIAPCFEKQGGTCAICRTKPAVHVDHDHATGRVRGILCFACNRGLGKVGDSVEVLRAMIAYLCENPQ